MERERKLQACFLKHQISFISKKGTDSSALNNLYGQISPLPSALVDTKDCNLPYKGSKSTSTTYLEKCYEDAPVVTS